MSGTRLSKRGTEMPESAMRKLAPLADAAKARGVKVIHLNIGQPDIETPAEFWDAVRDYPGRILAYAPSAGIAECREGLVNYYARYDIDVRADQLVVTTAGSESLLFALISCCDAGQEIIVPEPFYSNYDGLAQMAGLRLVPLTTRGDDGYRLPPRAEVEKALTKQTGAILYSSPGNPTGVVYSPDEVAMLGEIAKEHGLFMLADEVYREFTYDGGIATSALHLPGMEEHVVVLDSVSKRYSACGARIGCLVSRNAVLIEAVLKLAMTRLSAPALEQAGAAACVARTPPSYFDEVREEYSRRRDIVHERLNAIEGVFSPKPAGAFYTMARIEGVDTEHFSRWLLSDFEADGETVMVAPAAGFYSTPGLGTDEIRIAYVLGADVLSRAMDLLETAVHRYREEQTGRASQA